MSPPPARTSDRTNIPMGNNHQRVPDMGHRGHDHNHGPHSRSLSNGRPLSLDPGYMIMLPLEKELRMWQNPNNIDPRIGGHPALIIAEYGRDVFVALITTHSERQFTHLRPYIQVQHLPIAPSEPDINTGEQLHIQNGNTWKPSYVKAHQVFRIPKDMIYQGNCDPKSRDQLYLEDRSFSYVYRLAKEYQGTNSRHWPKHKTLRPFDDEMFDSIFPHGRQWPSDSIHHSPSPSSSLSSGSLKSSQTSGSDEATADKENIPPTSLLPESGPTEDNREPPNKKAKLSPSPPSSEPIAAALHPSPQGRQPPAVELDISIASGEKPISPKQNNDSPAREPRPMWRRGLEQRCDPGTPPKRTFSPHSDVGARA